MSFRPSQPVNRPVLISLCLMLAATAMAVAFAATAHGAYYKMVACSGSNGIPSPGLSINTNTRSSTYPEGIFHLWNFCDGEGGDPPGDGSLIRTQLAQPGRQLEHRQLAVGPQVGASLADPPPHPRPFRPPSLLRQRLEVDERVEIEDDRPCHCPLKGRAMLKLRQSHARPPAGPIPEHASAPPRRSARPTPGWNGAPPWPSPARAQASPHGG